MTETELRAFIREMLCESPDSVSGLDVDHRSEDAVPFGFDSQGNAYVMTHAGTHANIHRYYDAKVPSDREKFTYPGRAWTEKKIVSFWKYPESRKEMAEALSSLESELETKFERDFDLFSWKIEVPVVSPDEGGGFESDMEWRGNARNVDSDVSEFVKLQDYVPPGSWSDEEKAKQHVKSPMQKGDRTVPPGMGSRRKLPNQRPGEVKAKARARRRTSEVVSEEGLRSLVREELLRESADHEIRIKCNQEAAERFAPLLDTIKRMTQAGITRQVQVDDIEGEDSFLVDGDGPDYIESIEYSV